MKDPLFLALNEIKFVNPTDLGAYFRKRNLDVCLAPVISGIGLVKKVGKEWDWVGGNVDDELVEFVRDTTNQYKNYAI